MTVQFIYEIASPTLNETILYNKDEILEQIMVNLICINSIRHKSEFQNKTVEQLIGLDDKHISNYIYPESKYIICSLFIQEEDGIITDTCGNKRKENHNFSSM